jgi:hypothetical protein
MPSFMKYDSPELFQALMMLLFLSGHGWRSVEIGSPTRRGAIGEVEPESAIRRKR